jgi:hypothetical protein
VKYVEEMCSELFVEELIEAIAKGMLVSTLSEVFCEPEDRVSGWLKGKDLPPLSRQVSIAKWIERRMG